MLKVVSTQDMQAIEQTAFERFGCAPLELMEWAGRSLAEAVMERFPQHPPWRAVVLAGPGKNGGDGLVCARTLAGKGVQVTVVLLAGERLPHESLYNLELLENAQVEIKRWPDAFPVEGCSLLGTAQVVVDALLGIGAKGAPREPIAGAIKALAQTRAVVVSADIPSGLDADTGQPREPAVRADLTVTFGLPKAGLLQPAAASYVGQLRVEPLSFPPELLAAEGDPVQYWDAAEVSRRLPRRPVTAHKRQAGKVLVIGGSAQYHGALILAGQGAARAGAGFVRLAYPRTLDAVVRSHTLEELCTPLPAGPAGTFTAAALPALLALAKEQDAVVLGPGLGRTTAMAAWVSSFLQRVAGPRLVVVDADALAPRAASAGRRCKTPLVLTPHAGEAGRLLGVTAEAVEQDRVAAAAKLAEKWNAVVLLKGRVTLVHAAGVTSIVAAGTQALATAGTGDVLAGMIAALAGQGLDPLPAAAAAAFVHGRAGELAGRDIWGQGVLAREVAAQVPAALAQLRWEFNPARFWTGR